MFPGSWRIEGGFIAAMSLVLITSMALLLLTLGWLIQFAHIKQQSVLAADAGALTASETSRGLIAGYSCENAAEIVAGFDFHLDTCRIVGFEAMVAVSKSLPPFQIAAKSKADSLHW